MFETVRDRRALRAGTDADPAGDPDGDPGDPGGDPGAEEPRAESPPKVRLSRLALAAPEAPAEGRTSRPSSPRHAAPEPGGVAGRLVERWVPSGLTTGPVSRRRLALTAAVVGVLLVGGVAALVIGGRAEPERPPPLPVVHASSAEPTPTFPGAARPGGAARPATTAPRPTSLVVSVVGTVAEPGLITLPPGARVADAIERAGGAERDTDLHTVNLARKLTDGEQVYVGVPVPPGMAAAERPTGPGTGAGTAAGPRVNLNSADRRRLETLPGVGEVTARRILDWRARHGRFTAVEQLREIEGIGEKRLARLRDKVSVG